MGLIERKWTIRSDYVSGTGRNRTYQLASVEGPEQREPIEVVPASQLRGAVEALAEAVAAARTFNRGGMTWLEYDAALVRFERIANGGQ